MAPDRFEAGTPPIINIILFSRVLQLTRKYGEIILNKSEEQVKNISQLLFEDEWQELTGTALFEKVRTSFDDSKAVVPTLSGKKAFINLDNAASTQSFNLSWKVFHSALFQQEEIQQSIVKEVEKICHNFLGAPASDYDIIFTSNTTEAINILANHYSKESFQNSGNVILTTFLEHSANDLPWRRASGRELIRLPIDREGFIDLVEMEGILREYNQEKIHGESSIRLVTVCGASNVLGVYNDLETIAKIVHQYGAKLLVDGAQLIAHRQVNMKKWGIDFLVFSAHKVYAPFGTGVLAVRKGAWNMDRDELKEIYDSGSENAAGIAALGKSLNILQRIGMPVVQEEEQKLTELLLNGLAGIDGMHIFGIRGASSPKMASRGGVVAFRTKSTMSSSIASRLALRGIGIRYGCHCAHILVKKILKVSPGLAKFQKMMLTLIPSIQLPGVSRVSIGIYNTEAEIQKFLGAMREITGKVKSGNSESANSDSLVSKAEVVQQMKEYIRNVEAVVFE